MDIQTLINIKDVKEKEFMKVHYNKNFKSIITDNGSVFSDFLLVIEDTKINIYFSHPYCSGEKGTNKYDE